MATANGGSGLLRANLTVASGTLLSRITGLLRIIVFGAMIGQTALADAYDAANNAPNVVYELLLGGILAASLVPLFTRHMQDGDNEATSAIVSVALIALAGLTVVAVVFAPHIFRLFSLSPADGIDIQTFRRTGTALTRLFVVQIFFYGLTALVSGVLNARRRFFAAAWTPVLANLVTIAMLLAIPQVTSADPPTLNDTLTNRSLQWILGMGPTLGIVAMSIGMLIALSRSGACWKWNPDVRHPAVAQLIKLSGWAIGYVIANQVALIVVKNLASPGSGNVDAYSKAYTFFQLPHGLLAVSIATTFVPELARAAAQFDAATFQKRFIAGVRLTALVTIPASLGMLALAKPLVAMLLQHGNFDAIATTNTARALSGLAIGLGGFSIYLFVLRGFYAHNDTRTPFMINVFENLLNILFALVLVRRFDVFGLGLAFSLAYLVSAVVALFVMQRKSAGLRAGDVLRGFVPILIAAAIMGEVVWLVSQQFGGEVGLDATLRVIVGVVVGLAVYLAMLRVLRVREIHRLVN